jgi:membrane protease YdiL (CAAX protease family)
MAEQNKQPIPLYWLPLVFMGYALLCVYYSSMRAFGIPVQGKFPMGFVVYGAFTWVAVAFVLLVLKTRGWTLRDIGFKKPTGKMLLMGPMFFAIAAFIVYPLTMLINKAFGFAFTGMNYSISSALDVFVAVFFCALIIPMGEEILFRGVLIKIAQQKIKNNWLAGALAVLCFSAIHIYYFGVGGMIFITFWAVLPVFLFIRYDNIYPGYVMHFLNNLWAYLFVHLLIQK